MQLLLKNTPVLKVNEDGTCEVMDLERLPFALRKANGTLMRSSRLAEDLV